MRLKKQKGDSTLFILLLAIALVGVIVYIAYTPALPAQEVNQSGNFKVEMLFEHDGCKMNRFEDAGKYIYYAKCSNNERINTQTNWNETVSCGKGCVKTIPHQVSTNMENK